MTKLIYSEGEGGHPFRQRVSVVAANAFPARGGSVIGPRLRPGSRAYDKAASEWNAIVSVQGACFEGGTVRVDLATKGDASAQG